jgi:hypothetical protein
MAIRPLPREVSFIQRDGHTRFEGKVVDEVSCVECFPWGDYKKSFQFIEQEGSGERFVRFFYYVKKHGESDEHYRSGAQATLILKEKNFRKMIEKATKKWKHNSIPLRPLKSYAFSSLR